MTPTGATLSTALHQSSATSSCHPDQSVERSARLLSACCSTASLCSRQGICIYTLHTGKQPRLGSWRLYPCSHWWSVPKIASLAILPMNYDMACSNLPAVLWKVITKSVSSAFQVLKNSELIWPRCIKNTRHRMRNDYENIIVRKGSLTLAPQPKAWLLILGTWCLQQSSHCIILHFITPGRCEVTTFPYVEKRFLEWYPTSALDGCSGDSKWQ